MTNTEIQKVYNIPGAVSLIIGAVAAVMAGVLIANLAVLLLPAFFTDSNFEKIVLNWSLFGITAVYVSAFGIVDIPIGHAGVIFIVGQRVRNYMLGEGLAWILPYPFAKAVPVDMRENRTEVDGFDILCFGAEKTGTSVNFKTAILWKVKDPMTFIDVLPIAHSNIHSIALSAIRAVASVLDVITVLKAQSDFAEIIKKGSVAAEARWGLSIIQVIVSSIVPSDKEVISAFNQAQIEKSQKEAESTEGKLLLDYIRALVDVGLTPEYASGVAMAERGKIQIKRFDINQTGNPSLAGAAAIIAELLKERGYPPPPPDGNGDKPQDKGRG
ncbi:MAG: SPFH domain-containing protein [Candidatus Taylorbacteria bacterium]|nr:SPFH domain-containing protein [Candidatus Taylorbacteria bacterium]